MDRQRYKAYMESVKVPDGLKSSLRSGRKRNRYPVLATVVIAVCTVCLFSGIAVWGNARMKKQGPSNPTESTTNPLYEQEREIMYGKAIHFHASTGEDYYELVGAYDIDGQNHYATFDRGLTEDEYKNGKYNYADDYRVDDLDVVISREGDEWKVKVKGIEQYGESSIGEDDGRIIVTYIGTDTAGTIYVVCCEIFEGNSLRMDCYEWNNGGSNP